MDKFDHQIIDLLRQNARLSITEISEQVNLSRSAVTARIKKLEKDQVNPWLPCRYRNIERVDDLRVYGAEV